MDGHQVTWVHLLGYISKLGLGLDGRRPLVWVVVLVLLLIRGIWDDTAIGGDRLTLSRQGGLSA